MGSEGREKVTGLERGKKRGRGVGAREKYRREERVSEKSMGEENT